MLEVEKCGFDRFKFYVEIRETAIMDGWMDLQYTSQRAPPKMSGGSPLCEGKGGFPMEPTGWG